jgi:hypothetical protein
MSSGFILKDWLQSVDEVSVVILSLCLPRFWWKMLIMWMLI